MIILFMHILPRIIHVNLLPKKKLEKFSGELAKKRENFVGHRYNIKKIGLIMQKLHIMNTEMFKLGLIIKKNNSSIFIVYLSLFLP